MSVSRRHVTGAVLVSVLALAACGVPTQKTFDATDDKAFDVDPPLSTDSPPVATDDRTVLPVRPYYIAEQGITPSGDALATYEAILSVLQARPEDGSGLRTAVSVDTVEAIRPEGARVVVDLTEAFQSLPPEEQRLAAAQLVLTLTDRTPAVRVSFALSGEAIDVPTADNSVSLGGSVSRSDYLALLAPN